MNRRIDAHIARTQFGQLQDYLETVKSAPEWLRKAWAEAGKRGVDKLKMKRADAEIDVYRPGKLATEK